MPHRTTTPGSAITGAAAASPMIAASGVATAAATPSATHGTRAGVAVALRTGRLPGAVRTDVVMPTA
jgi:hypothetical protein